MIKSFRLRLALLSALLTGLALMAFGSGSWWLIRNIKIERIDDEVRTYAEREAGRRGNAADWERVEARLVSTLGIRDSNDLIFLVQDGTGETLYRSPHWPASLDVARLPWPQRQADKTTGKPGVKFVSEAFADESASGSPLLLAQAGPESGFDRPPDRGFRRDGPPSSFEFPKGDRASDQVSARPTAPERQNHEPAEANSPQPETSEQGSSSPEQLRPAQLQPPGPPPISVAISQRVDGQLWRIGLASTNRARFAVAINAHVIDDDMRGIRNAFFVALPISLILIGFGGWIFSSRALRPLKKLTSATQRVTAEGLNQRIAGQGEDREFVELIEVFNRMLERLERSFKQSHRFSADAAHELKTPLAILQGQLERAINTVEDGSPIQADLTSILDEVRRLSTISRKLLLLSQADAGHLSLHLEPFDLSKALTDLAEDTRMLAPHLVVTDEISPGLIIAADGSLLRQALHNLISNAIKYNVDQGWIKISTVHRAQKVEVLITNSSTGIPASERGRIFERFYRADPAHSRHIEGVGLGLSVSREIVRAHGGDLTLKASADGEVCFSLLLPRQM